MDGEAIGNRKNPIARSLARQGIDSVQVRVGALGGGIYGFLPKDTT